MAGELYIADKDTLDKVKSDTTSLIRDSYFTVDDLMNNKLVYNATSSAYTVTVLNVNGPGTLYFAVGHSADVGKLKVTVDGKIIYWRNIADPSTSPLKSGVIVAGSLLQTSTSFMMSETTRKYINTYALPSGDGGLFGARLVRPSSTEESLRGILLLQKPLKFNTSLKIEYLPAVSDTYGYIDSCYSLD